MQFDLFDAIRTMRHYFGYDGEILIGSNESGIKVRLMAFKMGEFHNYEFTISNNDIRDSNVKMMNYNFKNGVEEIHRLIDNYK